MNAARFPLSPALAALVLLTPSVFAQTPPAKSKPSPSGPISIAAIMDAPFVLELSAAPA